MKQLTQNISAVILDVGEVLIELDFSEIMRLKQVEGAKTLGEWLKVMDSWQLYDDFERGNVTEEKFIIETNRSLGTQFDTATFRKHWNSVLKNPVPGVEQLLSNVAKKIPLYALTNSNITHMNEAKRKFSLFKNMIAVFTSYELGARKPEQKIFELVTKKLKLPPAQILFVDDRKENVEGARSYGWNAELCTRKANQLASVLANYNIMS